MSEDVLLEGEPADKSPSRTGRRGRRLLLWLASPVVLILALYYPVGAFIVHRIDDDLEFAPAEVQPGASHAVAMAAALIEREVGQHAWPGNDPWFFPGYILDNMPNFQQGIIQALRRFTLEMTDQIGRARGSSQADSDLERARSLLNYSSDVWVWDLDVSWWPTAPSDQQYLAARDALISYNERLAAGSAVFDRRADNLLATLDRIGKDLGSASAALEQRVESHAGALIDTEADDRFYRTKGELYGYALLLRALGKDFQPIIQERALQKLWDEMLGNLALAAGLRPWVVVNGSPDGQFLTSHLASQGFFLLRARSQIYEISDVLLK
jgi:hypothetical protein